MKQSVKQYARSCLKFYILNRQQYDFDDPVKSADWTAAATTIEALPQTKINILDDVFSRSDTLADNIYKVARERGIDQDSIWALLNKVSKQVAKERGIL